MQRYILDNNPAASRLLDKLESCFNKLRGTYDNGLKESSFTRNRLGEMFERNFRLDTFNRAFSGCL